MTGIMTSGGFDYSCFDINLSKELRATAGRVRERTRAAFIEVGCDLLKVKQYVGHGKFGAWVKTECQLSIRTAERAMKAYEVSGKNDNLSYLPPDGLLALFDRSTPLSVREEIIGRIAGGEKPTAAEIRRRVRHAATTDAQVAKSAEQAALAAPMMCAQFRIGARRDAELETAGDEPEPQEDERVAAAETALELLTECVGARMAEFRTLFDKATCWQFQRALHNRAATQWAVQSCGTTSSANDALLEEPSPQKGSPASVISCSEPPAAVSVHGRGGNSAVSARRAECPRTWSSARA